MFFFFIVFIILYNLFSYFLFRDSINERFLYAGMSKTYIKKNKKGRKNYWLYSKIHTERGIGYLYYFNVVFLVSTIIFSIVAPILSVFAVLRPFILAMSCILCLVQVPCCAVSAVNESLYLFGNKFVFLGFYKSQLKTLMFSAPIRMCLWVVTAISIASCFAAMQDRLNHEIMLAELKKKYRYVGHIANKCGSAIYSWRTKASRNTASSSRVSSNAVDNLKRFLKNPLFLRGNLSKNFNVVLLDKNFVAK